MRSQLEYRPAKFGRRGERRFWRHRFIKYGYDLSIGLKPLAFRESHAIEVRELGRPARRLRCSRLCCADSRIWSALNPQTVQLAAYRAAGLGPQLIRYLTGAQAISVKFLQEFNFVVCPKYVSHARSLALARRYFARAKLFYRTPTESPGKECAGGLFIIPCGLLFRACLSAYLDSFRSCLSQKSWNRW